MAVVDPVGSISMKIDSNFAGVFDEIVNCIVKGRKAEKGFVDKKKLSLVMRPGTTKVGSNTLTGGTGTSRLFFHTTSTRQRFGLRGYGNKVYWNKGGVRTNIGLTGFNGNDFNYNTIRLPIMYAVTGTITLPTEYTTSINASGSEKVPKSSGDTGGAANIGKYMFITDNSGDGQAYRGCFGLILDYDSVKSEYWIQGAGIIGSTLDIGLKSGSKYQIYDAIGEHLQIIDGLSYDRYIYYNETSQTFAENTYMKGLATQSLRSLAILTGTQFTNKQLFFNNTMFTFLKGRIFHTIGNVSEPNPFFFGPTSGETISMTGDINDIYEFKERIIICGSNFTKLYTKEGKQETISSSWGTVSGGFNDMNNDAYVFTTQGQINSLVENIKGNIIPQNIGDEMQNYMADFNVGICTGFDGDRYYLYGRKDFNTDGKMIVLDTRYKFWSVWEGINPSSIVSEGGTLYFTNADGEDVVKLDKSVQTDNNAIVNQYITTREIDLDDAFAYKIFRDALFWFDNYDQNIKITVYAAMNRRSITLKEWIFNIKEKKLIGTNGVLGQGQIGAVLLGGDAFIEDLSYPYFEKITIGADQANIFKLKIEGITGSAFYLNQFDIVTGMYGDGGGKVYFDPSHTN